MAQTAAERKSAQKRNANRLKNGGGSSIAGIGEISAKAAARNSSGGSTTLAEIREAHRTPVIQPKQFGTVSGGGSGGVTRTRAVDASIQRPLSSPAGSGKSPNAAGGKVGSSISSPLSGKRSTTPAPVAPTGMDALRANMQKAGMNGPTAGSSPMETLRQTHRQAATHAALNANGGSYFGSAHIGPTPAAVPGVKVGGSPTGNAGSAPKGRAGKGPKGRVSRAAGKAKKIFLPKGSKHSGNNAKHLNNMTG